MKITAATLLQTSHPREVDIQHIYHIKIKCPTRTGKFTFYSSDDLKLQRERQDSLGIENARH